MKITREQLKGIVRETMIEENEYQQFFKKALEKTGKSIPQMSDEEKKDFFNKIDAAWKGKGEKNERFGRGVEGPTFGSANESVNEEIKVGSSVTVNYPTLKKPVMGKVKHILKSPTGLVYVLDGDKGVWDAKNVSLKESVNEGIGTIALGVAGGLILLKILKFVLKKVVGSVGMNVKLPKEKLLEIVKQTIAATLTKASGGGINVMDIMALQSYLKDEINAGRITTIKQIVQVVDKVSKK